MNRSVVRSDDDCRAGLVEVDAVDLGLVRSASQFCHFLAGCGIEDSHQGAALAGRRKSGAYRK